MKKILKWVVVKKATYDKTMQLLDSQAATINRQNKKLVELTLQLDKMRKENCILREQNCRHNHFEDILLGIKDLDYPDVIRKN